MHTLCCAGNFICSYTTQHNKEAEAGSPLSVTDGRTQAQSISTVSHQPVIFATISHCHYFFFFYGKYKQTGEIQYYFKFLTLAKRDFCFKGFRPF